MKILMLSDFFYPDTTGGLNRVVHELGKRLVGFGNRVALLTRNPQNRFPEHERVEGIEVFRYPWPDSRLGRFIGLARGHTKIFDKAVSTLGGVDILNPHLPLPVFTAGLTGRLPRAPQIFVLHSPWPEEVELKCRAFGTHSLAQSIFVRGSRWIESRALARSEAVVTLSQYCAQKVKEAYHHPRVSVIPGGVDLQAFQPVPNKRALRQEWGWPERKTVLVTLRNLRPRMGVDNLLRAFADVHRQKPETFLAIGGDGSLRERWQALSASLGLGDAVRFEGRIPPERLPGFYAAADLFVLPTEALEGFGLVTLEAMASGLPVLGTPVGGTPEILQPFAPECLLESGQPQDIAKGLMKILENRAKIAALGIQARTHVEEHYSWDRFAKGVENVFTLSASLQLARAA